MKAEVCSRCGASEWKKENGFLVCKYCGTSFISEKSSKESNIDLNDDVSRLLEKCRSNPKKARRYAKLVLDIDPLNEEALMFL